jgi:hypothetical protein
MSDNPNASLSQQQLHLMLKTHQEIARLILPAMQQAADHLTQFMSDPEDDAFVTETLRELSTELLIDELVKLLTRDETPISAYYTIKDVDGIAIDSLLASYNELSPDSAHRWFAGSLRTSAEEYHHLQGQIPAHLSL